MLMPQEYSVWKSSPRKGGGRWTWKSEPLSTSVQNVCLYPFNKDFLTQVLTGTITPSTTYPHTHRKLKIIDSYLAVLFYR